MLRHALIYFIATDNDLTSETFRLDHFWAGVNYIYKDYSKWRPPCRDRKNKLMVFFVDIYSAYTFIR